MSIADRTITGELAALRGRVEVIEKALASIQRSLGLLAKMLKPAPADDT